jgi:transcriptional regulator with XRE-family HTH domain
VHAFELVREARKRSDLSQQELAARAGTTQSAIARLEAGGSSPGFERVIQLVAACGLELRVAISEPVVDADGSRPRVPAALLEILVEHGVDFVVTGWLAASLRGGPSAESAPSVCPDGARTNLEVLCRALDALGARLRTPDGTGTLPLDRTPEELLTRKAWSLATSHGDLDVVLEPPGTRGYRDLAREATPVAAGGLELPTASLPDVVRELEAAKSDPDIVHVLRRLPR